MAADPLDAQIAERLDDEAAFCPDVLNGLVCFERFPDDPSPWCRDCLLQRAGTQFKAVLARVAALEQEKQAAESAITRQQQAIRFVHDTFVRDEAAGYRSRDRQFAIEVLRAALTVPASEPRRCEGRYPVPQTSPPREEPFDVTYRCGGVVGHAGPHGPDPASPAPASEPCSDCGATDRHHRDGCVNEDAVCPSFIPGGSRVAPEFYCIRCGYRAVDHPAVPPTGADQP